MKAIMISIKPKWVAKILNGEKTIEIRKKFPKDYVGWVYIYCTKGKTTTINLETLLFDNPQNAIRNGKVVARFWCDKVEEILCKENGNFYTNSLSNRKLLTQSCLTQNELRDYMAGNWKQKFGYWYGGYAIHITNLEVFDKPKEISEFGTLTNKCNGFRGGKKPLTRAPQSWCYVEV